jgi:AcrR family transcriptional regulator
METRIRSTVRRGDGATTRAQLLETAGQVFAEKGVARITGREVADRARTNSAAINYHFGGIENLYAEVLVEAHDRVASMEELAAIAQGTLTPKEKLRQLLMVAAATIVEPAEKTWALRILTRELLSPSSAFQILNERAILPKRVAVNVIVAEILGREPGDPVVARCALTIMAPVTVLLVTDPVIAKDAFPGFVDDQRSVEELADFLYRFAIGGNAAVEGRGD